MIVARGIAIALTLARLGAQAEAQDLKSWRHGVIEPKGDAGFMLMVGQRDFGAQHGLIPYGKSSPNICCMRCA